MSDSTTVGQLIPVPNGGPPESPKSPPSARQRIPCRSSLDDAIEHYIGNGGWAQIFEATLVSMVGFFDGQQTFITVFTDAVPKWSCIKNDNGNYPECRNSNNLCEIPRDSWTWDLPENASIISDWSLQCAGSILTGLPASSFFFGCLIGGFALATLADSNVGRKNALVLSSLIMSIAGVLTAFSSNIWMYSILRFVSGFGRATIGSCAFVLSTESVGKKWRESAGILGFILYTAGFLSLPGIAFCLRGCSWRLIYLWTCVPSVGYSVLLFFVVRESPRWLFIKGRNEEFVETLRSMAAPEKRSKLTKSFFSSCADWEEVQSQDTHVFSAVRILLSKVWSLRRLMAATVVGFGIGMPYYGMPLGLSSLSFNLYLSATLNALSEFPASLITFLLIKNLKRNGVVLGLTLLSGICGVSCMVVRRKGFQIALEVVSFSSSCIAFDVLLFYTLEMFPTCVRSSAVSMVRQAMILGGAVSPMIVAAGRENGLISYGVFGATISVCGVAVVCLPETKGRNLSDTMEEEEERDDAEACGTVPEMIVRKKRRTIHQNRAKLPVLNWCQCLTQEYFDYFANFRALKLSRAISFSGAVVSNFH